MVGFFIKIASDQLPGLSISLANESWFFIKGKFYEENRTCDNVGRGIYHSVGTGHVKWSITTIFRQHQPGWV